MFGNVIAKLPQTYGILKALCPAVTTVRHGHRIRGKPVGVARTIEQRIKRKLHCLRLGLRSISFKRFLNKCFAIESDFNKNFKII